MTASAEYGSPHGAGAASAAAVANRPALLEAREEQMVTQAEWDRLREAVEATKA